jgi:hypothetical protein
VSQPYNLLCCILLKTSGQGICPVLLLGGSYVLWALLSYFLHGLVIVNRKFSYARSDRICCRTICSGSTGNVACSFLLYGLLFHSFLIFLGTVLILVDSQILCLTLANAADSSQGTCGSTLVVCPTSVCEYHVMEHFVMIACIQNGFRHILCRNSPHEIVFALLQFGQTRSFRTCVSWSSGPHGKCVIVWLPVQ